MIFRKDSKNLVITNSIKMKQELTLKNSKYIEIIIISAMYYKWYQVLKKSIKIKI